MRLFRRAHKWQARYRQEPASEGQPCAAFGLTSFVSVLTLSAVVAGTVSGYTIFYYFGLSYADYATPSDAIIVALRSPVALGFWMASGAYAALVVWMTMASKRIADQVVGLIFKSLYAAPDGCLIMGG